MFIMPFQSIAGVLIILVTHLVTQKRFDMTRSAKSVSNAQIKSLKTK